MRTSDALTEFGIPTYPDCQRAATHGFIDLLVEASRIAREASRDQPNFR